MYAPLMVTDSCWAIRSIVSTALKWLYNKTAHDDEERKRKYELDIQEEEEVT